MSSHLTYCNAFGSALYEHAPQRLLSAFINWHNVTIRTQCSTYVYTVYFCVCLCVVDSHSVFLYICILQQRLSTKYFRRVDNDCIRHTSRQ